MLFLYYVYLLRCADGSLYCGITNDLVIRLREHNRGRGAKYTRGRLPVALVYSEDALSRSEALQREWEIKKMQRAAKEGMASAWRKRMPS
jgi:putative endonuclease